MFSRQNLFHSIASLWWWCERRAYLWRMTTLITEISFSRDGKKHSEIAWLKTWNLIVSIKMESRGNDN